MDLDLSAFARPALAFTEANQTIKKSPFRTGGQPLMPKGTQWPLDERGIPLHYFGEIALGRLPKSVDACGEAYALPAHPARGRLLIFLPMSHDVMQPVFVHVTDGPEACVIHPTPDNIPLPEDFEFQVINENYLAQNRREFLQISYHAKPLMSKAARNPLARDLDMRTVSEEERYRLDCAFAEQLSFVGIDHEVRPPKPMAAREALFHRVPYSFQRHFEDGKFEWTWDCIFAVSRRALVKIYELVIDDVEIEIELGRDTAEQRQLISYLKAMQQKISKSLLSDNRNPIFTFNRRPRPSLGNPIDQQFSGWMRYARRMRSKPVSEDDKQAFVEFLREIEIDIEDPRDLERPSLSILSTQNRTRLVNRDVRFDVEEAFKEGHKAKPAPRHCKNDRYALGQGLQIGHIFGNGYLFQDAAIEHEDKVPLLQICDAGGLAMSQIDGVLQIWIESDDLASGNFSKAFATTEAS